MKVIYKAGPCTRKQCCPRGDTHLGRVELRSGTRFSRGGDAVELDKAEGEKLIADHPGMFAEEGKSPAKKAPAAVKK